MLDYLDLRRTLLSKGETEEDLRRDHAFFYVEVDGEQYRATKLSHGARGQIPPALLGMIARQMRLTARELRQFVNCSLDRKDWLDLWQERGHAWRTR